MLAVHGQDVDSVLFGLAHDDLAGHDQDFLAGQGDVFACADGGQRRFEAGRANDGNQDDISFGQSGQFDQTFFAAIDFRRITQLLFQQLRVRFGLDADGFGMETAGLFQQQFDVIAGTQSHDLETV